MAKSDGCKQACCRVPFEGVCARKGACACHNGNQEVRDKITWEELVRAQAIRDKRNQ